MALENERFISSDVLVVGSGLAGLWAAIRAKDLVPKVTLVEKGTVARSGASTYCHTTMALVPPEEFHLWFQESVERTDTWSIRIGVCIMLPSD